MKRTQIENELIPFLKRCKEDWVLFAQEVLEANLDFEQQDILRSVQANKKTAVCSGTSRGKDYVAAVAALCFLFLTPEFDSKGKLVKNTKVALTAPTDRQLQTIMMPEISRLYYNMVRNGFSQLFVGKLTAYDLKTEFKEWFLTSFVADEHKQESWTGFHAVNTMFVVTEASGISETVFNAIEGNLQGNSRLLIVFNNNTGTGYAANSMQSSSFKSFRLDSLNAPNVLQRKYVIPGQVNYEWVDDRVKEWCTQISENDFLETEGDFAWLDENELKTFYRPNDLFRVKVRGMAPKVASDVLVPLEWIELANKNWKEFNGNNYSITSPLRLGADIAGMGRDSSCFCYRHGNYVKPFSLIHSGGIANHMQITGKIKTDLANHTNSKTGLQPSAYVDTIGEGAGVFSRLVELKIPNVYSVKFSTSAEWNGKPLKDRTEQYEFANMRAYLYWAIRDWLNPANKTGAALPVDSELAFELSQTKWEFMSNGKIKIESKDDIKKRIKRSPDRADSLAMTFYPVSDYDAVAEEKRKKAFRAFLSALH